MIGYFMGIVLFSAVMISANMVAFDDSELRRAGALLHRVRAALGEQARGLPAAGA
ncbi:MAG: hypothetical protein ACRD2E_10990 [Terriglobales bacterium]